MQQIILGDIHGRTVWKDIVKNHPKANRYIFIGDYVDSFNVDPFLQYSNLADIIQFKKDYPDRVILLIGNHDHHYWPGITTEHYSGYQPNMAGHFKAIYNENKNLFQVVFKDEDGVLYSHAGISRKYLRKKMLSVDDLNERHRAEPTILNYQDEDTTGYGDHPLQSPVWIRPMSLMESRVESIQVVGHTRMKNGIVTPKYKPGVWFIDTLEDKYPQYLVKNDEKFEIVDVWKRQENSNMLNSGEGQSQTENFNSGSTT